MAYHAETLDWYRLIPGYWTQGRSTSLAWDAALNHALDLFGVKAVGAHDCQVGPFSVWLSNYPYAFGYNRADPLEPVPLVKTRMRLRRMVREWQREEYEIVMRHEQDKRDRSTG